MLFKLHINCLTHALWLDLPAFLNLLGTVSLDTNL